VLRRTQSGTIASGQVGHGSFARDTWSVLKSQREDVVATSNSLAVVPLTWKSMLSHALVFNWNDLMPGSASGQIPIEHHVGPSGSVELLKVWGAKIGGHWDLICSCGTHSNSSTQSGLQFANGHKAETFRAMLDSMMRHWRLFRVETAPGADSMIQVSPRLKANALQHSR
jgi:hypothetical protein